MEKDFAMNHPKNSKLFLALAAGIGGIGLVLGRLLYALALDDRGLLVRGHLLSILLCLTIPASLTLALLALPGRKEEAPLVPSHNRWAPLGQGGAALAIAIAVVAGDDSALEGAGALWRVLGLLAALGLLFAAWQQHRGKMPGFAGYLALCLFLLSHLVSHYRQWCADPQILDYLFEMLGTVLWMLFAYYRASDCVGLSKPRMEQATGLMTVTLCLTALGTRANLWLCLAGVLFAGSCLYPGVSEEETP